MQDLASADTRCLAFSLCCGVLVGPCMRTMEMATIHNNKKAGPFTSGYQSVKALPKNICEEMIFIAMKAKELGQDHPRKIIHYLKVGLALTLVSLFYYFRLLSDGFGVNTIWADLTVMVVFEFSVGATLGKGLNRMLATSLTAALGIGAHKVAILSGTSMEPILLAFFVFIIAALVTFTRFPHEKKARHDYGLILFDLTFCLVSISGYRENQAIAMAFQRMLTIVLGSCTAIVVCICICPVWSSEQLQDLIAANMDKLGLCLEGFGDKYFRLTDDARSKEDGRCSLQAYRSVLTSKDKEEMLANLARWEPCHGQFRFCHPWEHHLKIGTLTRQCAYMIEVLDSYLHSDTWAPVNLPRKLQEPCMKISVESGNFLKEIASAVRKMTRPMMSVGTHLANTKGASEELQSLLKPGWWEGADLLEVLPATAVVSLLIDIAECLLKISEAVDELASLASFKCVGPGALRGLGCRHMIHQGNIQPLSDVEQTLQPLFDEDITHHIITIEGKSHSSSRNENVSRQPGENG